MAAVTQFEQIALPAPSDLERVEIHASRITRLFGRFYSGNIDDLPRLSADIDAEIELMPRLRQQLEALQRPASKKELADHLSVLRISFPTAKAAGDGFSRILIERVAAQRPTIGQLDWAIRWLIDHNQFLPSIAEVLQALASAKERVGTALTLVDGLPRLRQDVAKRVGGGGPEFPRNEG